MYNMSVGGCDECGGLCGEVCEGQVVEDLNLIKPPQTQNIRENATTLDDKLN